MIIKAIFNYFVVVNITESQSQITKNNYLENVMVAVDIFLIRNDL